MLTGKTALVTGGAKGIGRAIALKIAEAHGNVAIIYRGSQKNAEQTIDELLALGVQAKSYQCDVADFNATKELVAQVIKDFGGLDILVNNAGITNDKLLIAMKEEDFDSVLNTNLKGAFNMTKHVGAYLLKQRKGRIINISSVSGLMGNVGQCNYAAAKAGVAGMSRALAQEVGSRGITVNCVAPGLIETAMTAKLNDEQKAKILVSVPLGRMGLPAEIAAGVVYLASNEAGYVTGATLDINGGGDML